MRNGILRGLKMFTVVFAIGFLSIFVLSCGGSSGSDDNDDDGGGSQSQVVTGASGNEVSLNGTWGSGCVADIGDGESERSVMTISGSSFTRVENEWFDSTTCSGTSNVTINMSGTVVLGDEITVTYVGSNVTATETDVIISSFVGTVNSLDTASDLNTEEECGFNDWAVGVPKELLGTDCAPDSDFKDVIYLDDTADSDVIYARDNEGPVDVNDYPTNIDSDTTIERM